MGDPDLTTYTPSSYADGNAHVAIITRSGGVTATYVDGGNGGWGDAGTAPRTTADLVTACPRAHRARREIVRDPMPDQLSRSARRRRRLMTRIRPWRMHCFP